MGDPACVSVRWAASRMAQSEQREAGLADDDLTVQHVNECG